MIVGHYMGSNHWGYSFHECKLYSLSWEPWMQRTEKSWYMPIFSQKSSLCTCWQCECATFARMIMPDSVRIWASLYWGMWPSISPVKGMLKKTVRNWYSSHPSPIWSKTKSGPKNAGRYSALCRVCTSNSTNIGKKCLQLNYRYAKKYYKSSFYSHIPQYISRTHGAALGRNKTLINKTADLAFYLLHSILSPCSATRISQFRHTSTSWRGRLLYF